MCRPKDTETEPSAGQRSPPANNSLPLLVGASWSLLYTLLHFYGHSPSSLKGVFYFGTSYYAFGAAVVGPLTFILTLIVVATVRQCGRITHYSFVYCWNQVQRPYLMPLLVFLIVPEIVIFMLSGFNGLGAATPYLGFATVLSISIGVYRAARKLGIRPGRAFLTTGLAAILQAIPAGALLR